MKTLISHLVSVLVICLCISIEGEKSPAASSPWTEGVKTVLVIRVDFSDRPGEPISEQAALKVMEEVSRYFEDNSGGRTSLKATISPVIRAEPTVDNGNVDVNARAAARAAGFDTKDFDFEITFYNDSPMALELGKVHTNAGIAGIGGKGLIVNQLFTPGLLNHEVGHNYGFPHARFWKPTGDSPIGAGSMEEYGNPFDRMGSGPDFGHANSYFKFRKDWLPKSAVESVDNFSEGKYYLQPHDSRQATGIRALHVFARGHKYYWIERRTAPKENPWLPVGALIHWVYRTGSLDCDLLDMTPGSAGGAEDAPLVIGRTFSDTAEGIHITPTALTGDNHETMEITIKRYSTPGNRPPVVSISPPQQRVRLNQPVTLTVQAEDPDLGKDPDQDELAYYWDFGNGQWMGGKLCATVTPIFEQAGKYKVQCTVTDMVGGTATTSIDITVPAR